MKLQDSPTTTAVSGRDSLASLLLEVLTSQNSGVTDLSKKAATVALTFSHLAGSDDRLAQRYAVTREKALAAALAEALGFLEAHDLTASITIVDRLTASVARVPGDPISLSSQPCAFGTECVHQTDGAK